MHFVVCFPQWTNKAMYLFDSSVYPYFGAMERSWGGGGEATESFYLHLNFSDNPSGQVWKEIDNCMKGKMKQV